MAKKQPVKGAKPAPKIPPAKITPPKSVKGIPSPAGRIGAAGMGASIMAGAAPRTRTGSLGTRGNSISLSEAVRAVQYPESNSPETRKYYTMKQTERETVWLVEAAGGNEGFLFPDARENCCTNSIENNKRRDWREQRQKERGSPKNDPEKREKPKQDQAQQGDNPDHSERCLGVSNFIINDYIRNEIAAQRMATGSSERGIHDFVAISNLVALLVENDLEDYLCVMNTVLLGYPSAGQGTISVVGDIGITADDGVSFIQPFVDSGISASEQRFEIGSVNLSAEYSDRSGNQINWHIWAYVATSANPFYLPQATYLVGGAANYYHEVQQNTDPNSMRSWEDYLAGNAALILGSELRLGYVSPMDFGERFAQVFGFTDPTAQPNYLDLLQTSPVMRYDYTGSQSWVVDFALRVGDFQFYNDALEALEGPLSIFDAEF